MTFLISQLRSLLGGGASYLFLAFGAMLLFQHWQVKNLQAERQILSDERNQAIALIKERDSVIASQSRQYQRQLNTRKEEVNAQEIIADVPDSNLCIQSESVNSALDWLRDYEKRTPQNDDDPANVRMPGKAGTAE